MSSPGAGHQFPSQEVSWLKRDVLLFANSIGCTADELHFLYVSRPQSPTYAILTLMIDRNSIPTSPSSLPTPSLSVRSINPRIRLSKLTLSPTAFKLTDQEVTDFYGRQKSSSIPGVPKFDSRRVVDGQRKLTILKPLPTTSAGRHFELRNKVVGVYDKGKSGSVMETEQSVVDRDSGEVYSKTSSTAFFVGQGNWGGPKGELILIIYL